MKVGRDQMAGKMEENGKAGGEWGGVRAFIELSAWATLRARAHIRAIACSAAAMVLAVGAFTTRHPA
jgi:hypothetical protein